MRTDAKIGFAIVGVLLAVLTVYAIVVPKHSNTKKTGVALVQTPVIPTGADTPAPAPLIGTGDSGATASGAQPTKDLTPHTDATGPGPLPGTPGSGIAGNNSGGAGSTGAGSTASGSTGTGSAGTGSIGTGSIGTDLMPGSGDRGGVDLTHRDPAPPIASTRQPKTTPAPFNVPDGSTKADRLYTIQSGQTLSKIAYEVYGNARFHVAIQRENPGLDPNRLKVGSTIKLPDITPVNPDVTEVHDDSGVIPPPDMVLPTQPKRHSSASSAEASSTPAVAGARTYTVKSGDNLYAIARKLLGSGRKADEIYALNKVLIGPDKTRLKLGMVLKLPEQGHTAMVE